MVAKTDLKGRLLDLMTCVLELVRDGKRDMEEVCRVLQAIKDNKFRFGNGSNETVSSKKFPTWRTITLGTGLKTAKDFCKALKRAGCRVSDWAKDLMSQPAFQPAATKEIKVNLVNVSVTDLGFPNGATREQIYNRAKELGLELCPPEVGPQLRLQYKDQPYGEWLLVAMEPITASDGSLRVFGVEHDGRDLWLRSSYGRRDDLWHGGRRWVFVSRG